jgi:hypothetical protein
MNGCSLALAATLSAASIACAVTDPDHPVVKSYLGAEPVTPSWSTKIRPSEPEWSSTVKLERGPTVTFTAWCCIGGRFEAQYSDEKRPRKMGVPGDYVYPEELRIDGGTLRAYGMASGLAGGISQKTVIFEFDIRRRATVAEVEVDRRILPAARKPEGPRPSN